MAAAIVYEPRRDDGQISDRYLPKGAFRPALEATTDLWSTPRRPRTGEPTARQRADLEHGLSLPMYRWARGATLDSVLIDAELAAGDFVRVTKQAIDLLDQISMVADAPVGATARAALEDIRRGIVAYSSVG